MEKNNQKSLWRFIVVINKKIVQSILHFLSLSLYYLFRLFPIQSKLIVFSSERDYCDNSWALYKYIHENYSDYKFVWATLKPQKYNNDSRTKFVYHPYGFTICSSWYIARANYIFYTHGLGADLKIRKEQIVMNLWHGIAIKGTKGGIDTSIEKDPLFTHLIYLGELNKKSQATFLKCKESYLVPLGYPRNDLLLNNQSKGSENPFAPKNFDGKVIIWMPTFRKSINKLLSEDSCETHTGLPLFNSTDEIIQLNQYLKLINVCLITKIHHLQTVNKVFTQKFSNIIFITDDDLISNGIQLYQIIGKSDALLTDYSSVFIDYLLLNKPIGFILDDIEEYEKNRGKFLFHDVKKILAGEHIYNIEQLYMFFDSISNNIDIYRNLRENIINSMITYQDNNSCKRICDFCGIK
jgi:CDP-glycerol glycerophosphotransferase (TagB/SpsB family)